MEIYFYTYEGLLEDKTTITSICVYGDIYPTKYMGKTTDTFFGSKFRLPKTAWSYLIYGPDRTCYLKFGLTDRTIVLIDACVHNYMHAPVITSRGPACMSAEKVAKEWSSTAYFMHCIKLMEKIETHNYV